MVSGFFSSAVVAGAAFIFATFLFLAKIYRRCPSNQILVVFGRVGQKRSVQCYHGGGTFVWPLIQASAYLNLTPRSIHIPLKGALSQQNIRINVPSTFTVAVGITPEVMHNAAVRMLGLGVAEIESMATEIII
ncbi:MAG: flotillin family protein, partial [Chlamydiia bacterium]|nr:flotillin family protein [Chlamydiia bacterium]